MRIRHLKYFLVIAEELNFTHASERVHIEPSSLAHAIHDLEAQLNVKLLNKRKGNIQLTWPGEVMLEEARRMLSFFEDAQSRVHAASNGLFGRIRIGLADGLTQPRLTKLLAKSREEDPTIEIRITEMTTTEMWSALRHNQIDIGITVDGEFKQGFIAQNVWNDSPAVAIPTNHPLLTASKVYLLEAMKYPMIMCHPEKCAGGYKVVSRWFSSRALSLPEAAEYVSGHEQMLMLVAAGYGIGMGLASQLSLYTYPGVIVRPMEDDVPESSICFVRTELEPECAIERFMHRAEVINNLK
ncbi:MULTISPECIES: LysR family transcriptional regulator [Sodalis]|uniref:DNA-binding transcriptional LysR family regulator n=1 Tax=Sodalis ligni TaxID=2697027 RepID=A0A4R1N589_9GAMM|nr:LysR family transcriptional regulator [Sodalis ligni]TCL02212.1 DNA-binding transcriptional LysR family regulator [Sodalis ligni]